MLRTLTLSSLILLSLMHHPFTFAFTAAGKGVKLMKELIEMSPDVQGWFEDRPLDGNLIQLAQSRSYAYNTTAKLNTNARLRGSHYVHIINQTNQAIHIQYQYMIVCDGHFVRKVDWFYLPYGTQVTDRADSFMTLMGRRRAVVPINVYTQIFADGGITDIATGHFQIL